ncbi:MAG TPA: hypothetical protein VN605_08845, partial [Thermoanaerobaculia bacterium]|nr:hypothetical protein [Thermoanaerobaculia bacterium]
MATFEELRQQLQQARADVDAKADAAFAAGQRLWRIERQRDALRRGLDPQNEEQIQRAAAIEAAHAKAVKDIAAARATRDQARGLEAKIFVDFEKISDPRNTIGQLDDRIPILLLPVRLETRFKGSELWLRIYPDDISVDTFEPMLSQSEVVSAKEYWTGMWQGRGFEDQERGAWRGLVASHSAGRAAWILDVRKYEPLNLADLQPKTAANDVVLTIPTEELPDPAETAAVGAYWIARWKADGDAQQSEDSFADLVAALGGDDARATEIASGAKPSNFDHVPVPPATKTSVTTTFSWVVFPKGETLDLKESSWSRAARAVLLPDRFVFIGYRSGAEPRIELGRAVPSSLVVGPDPNAPEDDRLGRDAAGNLVIPSEMQWMVDFVRAVGVGMGFRLQLDAQEAAGGFDRVLVVGIRAGDGEAEAAKALAGLIEHHRFSRKGFELVPQGTPTNNTEAASTPYARGSDADAIFDDRKAGDLFTHSDSPLHQADGQWLAEWLGLEEATFQRVHGADGLDQSDARAMNIALWPATIGYWMESLMEPGFDDAAIQQTREFFTTYVSGRGAVPAIRVGRQPYGILPATALSRMEWLRQSGTNDAESFLSRLYTLMLHADQQWRLLLPKVAYAGKDHVDPHQNLLDIVGLHAGAASWSYRWAETAQQYWNHLKLLGFAEQLNAILQQAGAVQLLNESGWIRKPYPNILEKFFFGRHDPLGGPLIDDVPLSESAAIREYTPDHRNYLQWLLDASRTSLQALYAQDGFTGDDPPKALLYLLLRHALQLGYHDVAVRLHVEHHLLDGAGARALKRDDPFIHVRQQAPQSESRYQILYKTEPLITGSMTQPIGQFIALSMAGLLVARPLTSQLEALELLKRASTARLERAFAEHIDCCGYRLDAWMLGLVHLQLSRMRNLQAAPRRTGIHLGAYAWLEDLRPE